MYLFFFFNDTATTEIYTLSLHDALPICGAIVQVQSGGCAPVRRWLRVHGMQHREPDVPGDLRGTGRALQGSLGGKADLHRDRDRPDAPPCLPHSLLER